MAGAQANCHSEVRAGLGKNVKQQSPLSKAVLRDASENGLFPNRCLKHFLVRWSLKRQIGIENGRQLSWQSAVKHCVANFVGSCVETSSNVAKLNLDIVLSELVQVHVEPLDLVEVREVGLGEVFFRRIF